MTVPALYIVDPDKKHRQLLALLLPVSAQCRIESFATLDEAKSAAVSTPPKLLICSWKDGGAGLLNERLNAPKRKRQPELLILSDEITPARISICQHVGNAHLIPSPPLNMNALRNRILLHLEGPMTLSNRLSRPKAALIQALETLPALRKRLAL